MRIAYYRVSTLDQTVDAQRHALGGGFDREFSDEGVRGGVLARDRPGFAQLLQHLRPGDTVCVYAVDRLGRDALDVQATVRGLLDAGATLEVYGLGPIGRGVGELILAVLAQVAEMERRRIVERTHLGREATREALKAGLRTKRGRDSLGRPKAVQGGEIASWRAANNASIKDTALHFKVSVATVKRYCAIGTPT